MLFQIIRSLWGRSDLSLIFNYYTSKIQALGRFKLRRKKRPHPLPMAANEALLLAASHYVPHHEIKRGEHSGDCYG